MKKITYLSIAIILAALMFFDIISLPFGLIVFAVSVLFIEIIFLIFTVIRERKEENLDLCSIKNQTSTKTVKHQIEKQHSSEQKKAELPDHLVEEKVRVKKSVPIVRFSTAETNTERNERLDSELKKMTERHNKVEAEKKSSNIGL
jgi:predicted membrane protein